MFDRAEPRAAPAVTFSTSGKRSDRTLQAILLLAVIALGGVWSLLPNAEEKTAGLIDDGRYADALTLLDAARAEGALSVHQNQMLLKLYALTVDRLSVSPLLTAVPVLQATSSEMTRRALLLFREGKDGGEDVHVPPLVVEAKGRAQDLLRLRVGAIPLAPLTPSDFTTSIETSLE